MGLIVNNPMDFVLKSFLEGYNIGCLLMTNENQDIGDTNYRLWNEAVEKYQYTKEPSLDYYELIDDKFSDIYVVTKTTDAPRMLLLRDLYNIDIGEVDVIASHNILLCTMGQLRFIENFNGSLIPDNVTGGNE